ncbi:TraR/DksA C4-type zinc finger protein [Paenibacillus cymbidii]|uniref:TraR/DksA C4-type zinc finger protein n=1 Tax=Paenibacillus cymbidii TaxID=1639034 RepID=UPI0010822684|nr:TraR/DksA C4-type zinc finger protein [Paenibacillus cymbidii]
MNSEQTAALRQLLLSEKTALQNRIEQSGHFGLHDSLRESSGDLSALDNHPADSATETYERGKDVALNEQAEHALLDVEAALSRLEQGEGYGICETCGTEIPFERLLVVPATRFCVHHVPDAHVSERRPVEESFLAPPFGRTSLDERQDQNGFDGEDAWQIVESWGSSNTPAMAEDPDIDSYNNMQIEADEHDGYVEPFESFVATDLYGREFYIVRNRAYDDYMHGAEGEPLLEPNPSEEDGAV